MGANSKIEWTTHTFNPWRGCTRDSEACRFCYAETMSVRNHDVFGKWGPSGSRVIAAESYWRGPVLWNKRAAAERQAWERAAGGARSEFDQVEPYSRPRVFCASLADWLEHPKTMPASAVAGVMAARVRLFRLIKDTPELDWLLLTKRPQHFITIIRATLDAFPADLKRRESYNWLSDWLHERAVPANVWVGATVEDQANADRRIPALLQIPARLRFLSMEPLLGPVDLRRPIEAGRVQCLERLGLRPGIAAAVECTFGDLDGIHWAIVGGESGRDEGIRPTHPEWVRGIRDQCIAARVPFFFKQWGEHLPNDQMSRDEALVARDTGKNWTTLDDGISLGTYRVGKKNAGRELDGREWNEFPEVKA